MTFFSTPYDSPVVIVLTVIFGIAASITTLDIRLQQARRTDPSFFNDPQLPSWVALVYWVEWGVHIAIFCMNWKYALIIWAIKFGLKVLPVLEIIGNILMAPFKPRQR